MTKLAEAGDTQPNELVTVYVYVPAGMAVEVKVDPSPVLLRPPGNLINVHVPDAGNPLSAALPVELVHVGLVIEPISGAVGIGG
jgi:hypothetical protein